MVIEEWWKKFGFGPSLDDIMGQTGDRGRGNVSRICKTLIALKHCKGEPRRARSIRPAYIRMRDVQ